MHVCPMQTGGSGPGIASMPRPPRENGLLHERGIETSRPMTVSLAIMAIIVIGGHSRNIGKTSVAAGLIRALANLSWTAVKITQYGHGKCSIDGRECGCADNEHPFSILEERNSLADTDTSRFLAAGAAHSLWVRVRQGQLESVMPSLLPIIYSERFVIIESNSIVRHLQPDMYVVVLRYDIADWKESAAELLSVADAAVLVESESAQPSWKGIPAEILAKIPVFTTEHPGQVPMGLVNLVRSQLLV